jgi:hypothetical protein
MSREIEHTAAFNWLRGWRRPFDFSRLNQVGIEEKKTNIEIFIRGWLSRENATRPDRLGPREIASVDWQEVSPDPLQLRVLVGIRPGPIETIEDSDDDESGGGNLTPTPPPQPPPPDL